MNKPKKVDSKEIGLEMGLLAGKHLFNTEHMHYGIWKKGMEVNILNLPKAQENHSDFIIQNIPKGVRTILDVGCGVGALAAKLTRKGYQVDCVSPLTLLSEYARQRLGTDARIYETRYEDLQTNQRYDMILFSESFQYVPIAKALEKSYLFLNENGYLLVCDFFQTDAAGKSALGGGHKFSEFSAAMEVNPFRLVSDRDITGETAPNIRIVNDILMNVGKPVWNRIFLYMEYRHSVIAGFLKWKFRKKIDKINSKYFSGERNEENFRIYKTYRLMLFQKVKSSQP